MKKTKVLVVIPVYNEEKNIGGVLDNFPKNLVDEILVVDNASKDKTVNIVKKYNVSLIVHKKNLGKTSSLRTGFNYALEKSFDIVIIIDGDGEHDSNEISKFLDKIKYYDIVVGERKMYRSFGRNLVNKWNSLWVNLVIPNLDDVQCGFRAIKIELIKKIKLYGDGFELEINLLLEAVKNNAKIGKITIKTNPKFESKLKFRDYIKINNFFDRWVLKNYRFLNINPVLKVFLIISVFIGLCFGKMGELFF